MHIKIIKDTLIDSSVSILKETGLAHEVFNSELIEYENQCNYDLDITIAIHGDISGQLIFSWNKKDALNYANIKMRELLGLSEEHSDFDELIFEVMAEFTNEIAGVFLTLLSRYDINIMIMPPIIFKSGTIIYPKSKINQKIKIQCSNYEMFLSLFAETIDSKVLTKNTRDNKN